MREQIITSAKFMLILFCAITTFQVLLAASLLPFLEGYYELLDPAHLSLRSYLIFSAANSAPVFILIQRDTASLLESRIRRGLHLIVTLAIAVALSMYFRWVGPLNLTILAISFVVIYAFAYYIWDRQQRIIADQINKRIEQRSLDLERRRKDATTNTNP